MINRYNYEQLFLLYADDELSPEQRLAVEAFVRQNTDLREELAMLQQVRLIADEDIVFEDKEALLQCSPVAGTVNIDNYEEFFLLYSDNELPSKDRAAVEEFVLRYPEFKGEFELITNLKLVPDIEVVFPEKGLLYKIGEKEGFGGGWWKIAVAAMLLLVAGTIWIAQYSTSSFPKAAIAQKKNDAPLAGKPLGVVAENASNVNHQASQPIPSRVPTSSDGIPPQQQYHAREESKVSLAVQQKSKHLLPAPVNIVEDGVNTSLPQKVEPQLATMPVIANAPDVLATNEMAIAQPSLKPESLARYTRSVAEGVQEGVSTGEVKDEVIVANYAVNRNRTIKGFLKKASHAIERSTSLRLVNKPSVHIGNIEIAFQ